MVLWRTYHPMPYSVLHNTNEGDIMRSSAKIQLMSFIPDPKASYEKSDEYRWGFEDAKEKASDIAHEYDMVAARMAGALAEINLDDPKVVDVLGLNTTFNIGTALRMYREQQAK